VPVIVRNLLFLGMRKGYLYAILILLSIGTVQASHIVGGEFQLKAKRGYNYELVLRMYYDDINAAPGLLNADLTINVAIYKKVPNGFTNPVDIISMTRDPNIDFIHYNYNECTDFNQNYVRTRLFTYTKDIFLDPSVYNDPNGYYVVWERCCRNAVITNIQNPDNTGNAFYLEFPAVADAGGTRFPNSSPLFHSATGDFPCVGQPFTYDFSAYDLDGDSLTYQLVTPLAGLSAPNTFGSPVPNPPHPAPYPLVTWKPGYGVFNEIPGTPPLYVDAKGILHVTPNQVGLFAIALKVDEYRNGVKIGSVRRDFQFPVINCPLYPGPIIKLAKPAGGGLYTNGDTLKLSVQNDTCLTLIVSDSSTTQRNLSIQTIKSNIPSNILTISKSFTAKSGDTVRTPMCFDACRKLNIVRDTVFYLEMVVQDQQCPAPKTDTLRLSILYKPQINSKPRIYLDTVSSPFKRYLRVGEVLRFNVIGQDSNVTDILTLTGSGQGFNLSDYDMNFNDLTGSDSIVSPFYWQIPCKALDRGMFKLSFILKDNSCILTNRDTVSLTLFVRDTATEITNYEPPNFITPNGDNKNDFFQLVNLPIDNCEDFFAGVAIYNRWGAKVYESYKRDFKWDPTVFSDGLYYYLIDFHSKKVKGWLQVVR
jgi:gliding motility-associated-like protein